VHGGAIATLADEAMTWAASWSGKRFCVCGELTLRYRRSAALARPMQIQARVLSARPRLIQTTCQITDLADATLLASGAGKYVPMSPADSDRFMRTLVPTPSTQPARQILAAQG
jgi:acyl-coenzyme A thioesterase PaaI-like protein